MTAGFLTPRGVPVVPIEIAGGQFDAAIDTGFESGVQLPLPWLSILNPPRKQESQFLLPNGYIETTYTYLVRIGIDGEEYEVEAYFSPNNEVLIGLESLRGHRLEINFAAGSVLLERVTP
jgi:predicted aspartyl protease